MFAVETKIELNEYYSHSGHLSTDENKTERVELLWPLIFFHGSQLSESMHLLRACLDPPHSRLVEVLLTLGFEPFVEENDLRQARHRQVVCVDRERVTREARQKLKCTECSFCLDLSVG